MCQSKSATGGVGKRCFVHSAGTKASLNYIHAKTGIDKQQIYAIMKELRKEGKGLDAPTPEELEKYFGLEEFKTRWDNTLSEKEKVTILKQILAARLEAERDGVTGGVFHAWKNALQRTVQRIKKPMLALGLAGTLMLTACTGGGGVQPTPNGTDSTNPPTTVACSTENPGPYGDVIPKEEVTDEYGEYCQTTIDPSSDALVYDSSKVDLESLQQYGFTEDDAKAAQKTAVTFAAEQALDSTRLDNYSTTPTDWIDANSSSLFNPSVYLETVKTGKLSDTGLIVTDYLPTPTVRDSGPRSSQTNLQVNKIYAFESQGKKAIAVEVGANAMYDVTNEQVVNLYLANYPEETADTLKTSHPDFFGSDPVGLTVQGTFSYSFVKDDLTKIAGSKSTWTVGTQTGTQIVQ